MKLYTFNGYADENEFHWFDISIYSYPDGRSKFNIQLVILGRCFGFEL